MSVLALIGGGSVRTLYFLESLLKFHERLGIGELRVMDNDPERLHIFGSLCLHLRDRAGSALKITLEEDFRRAVRGSDTVVTSIRVGQDAMRARDERIAAELGLLGQETTGAGGFSYALRTLPVMRTYMEILREESPRALVFNFTNPSGLVTQAMHDWGFPNVIGICDNATGIQIELSKALRVDAGALRVRAYGLNHLSWVNAVEWRGENILPRLLDSEAFVSGFHPLSYFDKGLIRLLGEIPNGYLYYYYHRERALANTLRSPRTRGEQILDVNSRMIQELRAACPAAHPEKALKIYRSLMAEREGSYMKTETGGGTYTLPFDPKALGIGGLGQESYTLCEGYAGVVFNYLESARANRRDCLSLNTVNGGAIPGMDKDDVTELSCEVGGQGAAPLSFGEIPPSNLLLMQTIKRFEKLTILASREKSKGAAEEALTLHPLIGSYSLARELVNRYCVLNREYIGEWT